MVTKYHEKMNILRLSKARVHWKSHHRPLLERVLTQLWKTRRIFMNSQTAGEGLGGEIEIFEFPR